MKKSGRIFLWTSQLLIIALFPFNIANASKKEKEGPRVIIFIDESYEGKKNKNFTDTENAIRKAMGEASPCFVKWDLGHQIPGMNGRIEQSIKKGRFSRAITNLIKKNDVDLIITGSAETRDRSRMMTHYTRSMKTKTALIRLKVIDARKTSSFFTSNGNKPGMHIEDIVASRLAVQRTINSIFFAKHDNKGSEPSEFYLKILSIFQSRFMLEKNLDINKKNPSGETLLHYTSKIGNLTLAKTLIAKGADINAVTNEKSTPLHFAALQKNSAVLSFLIDKGASVNATDAISRTPIHLSSKGGITKSVEILIKNKASVTVKDEKDRMPIHLAAEDGHSDVVSLLVKNGSEINEQDKNDKTPLHYAAASSDLKTVTLLLGKGASVSSEDNEELTPLHHAAQTFNEKIVSLLIKSGAKVDASDNKGWTSLHYTALLGRDKIAKVLMKQGANVNAKTDDEVTRWNKSFPKGSTPLSIATLRSTKQMITLFKKNGAQ